ncbi:MAG: quercetin 2,3-dioxygenase [Terracidiphilus sp.]
MTQQIVELPVDALDRTVLQDSRFGQVKHLPAGTGAAYWGPGELMTFLITGEETGGAFFMAHISVAPGGGTPPHIHHREDESFHLLEGTLSIQVGGNTITALPGDFVYLPRGVAHSFRNTGEVPAKALVLTAPAGLEGFFMDVFEPVLDHSAVPPAISKSMIDRAIAASPKYGLELLPPA